MMFGIPGAALAMIKCAKPEKKKLAIGLIILYATTQLVRQLIQPKLVADSMGLTPLVTLVLLYVGYKMGSVFGMILAVPAG